MISSLEHNLQYYCIGGLTVQVEASFPLTKHHFNPKFELFRLPTPEGDVIRVRHHLGLPDMHWVNRSQPHYGHAPWEIHHQEQKWIYLGIPVEETGPAMHMVAIFDEQHAYGDIYHPDDRLFRAGNLDALTLIPTDQILLARVLATRQACLLHACGMVIQGHGLAFVGHSEAGKTTTARMLQDEGELLCDDRIIVRRWPEGFRVYGTWSHGDIPQVSASSAPLRAVFLLEQAPENHLTLLSPSQAVRALPEFVVKGLVTRDWWENVLDTLGHLARSVPVYRLRLDKSGAVVSLLREFLSQLDATPDKLP